MPSLIHCLSRSTCSLGQGSSHGMLPPSTDARIAADCAFTSSYEERSSPYFFMLSTSGVSRNRGRISFAKLSKAIELIPSSHILQWAGECQILDPQVSRFNTFASTEYCAPAKS